MIERLKEMTMHEERYLLFMTFALFLPFYITGILYLLMAIRLLMKKELIQAFKDIKGSQWILLFCILELIVSLIYQNYMGALLSVGILLVFSMVFYYRKHINKAYFEIITSVIMYMSVFCAFYALMEYITILNRFNITAEIVVFNTPKNRINSVFYNANYYAMMINFFVGITFYKILRLLKKEINYYSIKKLLEMVVIIGLNLFCLYLTGCRTAWPSLAVGLAIMILFDRHYKIFAGLSSILVIIAGYFFTHIDKIPRIDNVVKYLGVRMKIWEVALKNFTTHPLFGEGPMTYWHIYKNYPGAHPTQHAHNIFVDPLCSFGIVGILTVVPFVYFNLKETIRIYKSRQADTLVALIFGIIAMTIIHGLMDLTIFFVQTGIVFLLITNSFTIIKD